MMSIQPYEVKSLLQNTPSNLAMGWGKYRSGARKVDVAEPFSLMIDFVTRYAVFSRTGICSKSSDLVTALLGAAARMRRRVCLSTRRGCSPSTQPALVNA
jgi:hypothetical protein